MILSSASAAVIAAMLTLAFAMPANNCPINSVCFAIDQSGSVRGFYPKEQEFVVDISEEIASRTTNTKYSAFGFSSSSSEIQSSTTDLQNTFIPSINKPVTPSGSTNMNAGLTSCFNEIKSDTGNRLIVLITDGLDNGTPRADVVAPVIKAAGVSIVTVGIGNSVSEMYLKSLASGPEFFIPSSFSTLPAQVVTVVESSCVVVVAPTTPVPVADACAAAYDACDFKFMGKDTVPTFKVTGKPDRPFTPKIVSRQQGERIGVVNSNNIIPEFIMVDGSTEKITEASTSPKYRPTHFKPFSKNRRTSSGIGHQTYHGDQKEQARKRCIRVYFSSYQLLTGSRPPYVKNNIHVDQSANKCVVFKSA